MPYPSNGNIETGFTLVEVIVSLAAMAIGFIILWTMHFASLRMENSDQMRADALGLASAAIEAERSKNLTYPGSNATVTQSCDNATIFTLAEQQRFDSCTVAYQWPEDWKRQVSVTVTWKERISLLGGGSASNKRSQQVQLSTIYIDH